jgi:hypothetical protein
MMAVVSISKTSANFHDTTRRSFPEDSHLHTRRREKLESRLKKKNIVTATLISFS